jgi:hypothetical protein
VSRPGQGLGTAARGPICRASARGMTGPDRQPGPVRPVAGRRPVSSDCHRLWADAKRQCPPADPASRDGPRTCTVSLGSLWRCTVATCGLADLRRCWPADRERPRPPASLSPVGHAAGTAGVILIVGGLCREVRGWPQMWRFRRPRKWVFTGSSQLLHLVSMRAVLDCRMVRPSGGYRMSGLRREGPVLV